MLVGRFNIPHVALKYRVCLVFLWRLLAFWGFLLAFLAYETSLQQEVSFRLDVALIKLGLI